jgi:hypothetical protein
MSELQAQVAEAVKARRLRKVKTRTNQKYLKMSRKQLDNFLEQEGRFKLGASITRFAVRDEESDEEKANCKREEVIENQARLNRKRAKKRKEQRKRKLDEMLKYKSEVNRSELKLGRKTRHQQAAKLAKQKKEN